VVIASQVNYSQKARKTMPTQPKVYTEEFKREAVRLAKKRGNIAQTAPDLGVSDTRIITWRRQLEEAPEPPFPGQGNPRDVELAKLKRENARLKEENEILKKAVGIFPNAPR
jgi:transposase-like protein